MATEKANVREGRGISGVWIIPLLALLLGGYVVVHTLLTEGPEIEVSFTTAEGLEQGKTKVKYRNVNMGVVESVRLSDDLEGVVATVKLDRQAEPLLREDTRFWVVTARVGAGNISGLDTLLSGAYIQLAPGEGVPGRTQFEALEKPPLTPIGAPGLRLNLTSQIASSVSAGDRVLYKGYEVGRVESREFDPDERLVRYVVFIDAPYHELVNTSVRFWDVSGVSVTVDAEGFKVQTGSVDTVLLGGVAFDLPPGIDQGDAVDNDAQFALYDSYDDILQNPYLHGRYYVVYFKQSIKGLLPGAPVEFRGIEVGRVERVMLQETVAEHSKTGLEGEGDPIPVLIYLEPARLSLPDKPESLDVLHHVIKGGIGNGMRASMESGNLLTGAKYISIDYFDGLATATMGDFIGYPTIPTIETGLGQLEQKVGSILDMVSKLPLDETVESANEAIASLNDALEGLSVLIDDDGTRELPTSMAAALVELQETLKGFAPNSPAYQSLDSSLLKLNRALSDLEVLTDTLSRQPNSLVLPSDSVVDPIPEAKQ